LGYSDPSTDNLEETHSLQLKSIKSSKNEGGLRLEKFRILAKRPGAQNHQLSLGGRVGLKEQG
jgi:hypothetical protein